MTFPVLPESAPFTAAQRAWLNGFFAGLLGLENGTNVDIAGTPAASLADAASATSALVEEDFPWHDPAIPLEERLLLAEDRPIERQLMAAMAQLDCGACGYQCKSYSEAIARGDEKNLSKCAPGGRETSRKLKEIVTSKGTNPTTASTAAMVNVVSGNGSVATTVNGSEMTSIISDKIYNRCNPFPAKLIASNALNKSGSSKDTRLVIIDLEGSGLVYKPGDALGVYPENCPELVDQVLRLLRAEDRLDLRSLLIRECSLARPGDDLLERFVEWAIDPEEALHLTQLRDADDPWIDRADLLDVLIRHPSLRPDPDELVSLLARLQPRLYSISSSQKAHPREVHLTVGVVRYYEGRRLREGVASSFLANRVPPGDEVRVFIQPSHRFQLPDHGDTPMIMVGPGTGIAPFRAFLEERHANGAGGKNWLFFGDRSRATDFLYEDELRNHQRSGLLTRLDLAFSRDQEKKIYVQNQMLERGPELWDWLEEGAHFYVCGDAKRMATDVDRALHTLIVRNGGLSATDAKGYVAAMVKNRRYQRDIY
jgi:sulfite reductase (NADPH) flavoprotein alpha-component